MLLVGGGQCLLLLLSSAWSQWRPDLQSSPEFSVDGAAQDEDWREEGFAIISGWADSCLPISALRSLLLGHLLSMLIASAAASLWAISEALIATCLLLSILNACHPGPVLGFDYPCGSVMSEGYMQAHFFILTGSLSASEIQ